ncbi:DsbA family protein [Gemmatimonas sp.]|uniref:DsbA family protein n=1 Tax=Gemmatimonas sp. TaxID=1962908 RepID=UPI003F72A4B5
MNKHESFDRAISVLILLVAIAAFGVVIRNQFTKPQVATATNERSAKRIADWAEKSREAKRVLREDPRAAVTLTVFTDFECPFCRRLDSLVADYSAKHKHGLALQLIHLPLGMHLNAIPAAHAFECALEQGKSESFARSLYERQSSLGDAIWESVATSAGVPSLSDFQACMRAPIPAPLEAGKSLAKELGVSITPTVVVNDWLITPADPEYVFEAIKAVAAGRSPNQ